MKKLVLSLALLVNICLAETAQEVVDAARARAQMLKTRTSNLFVVDLPAGDVPGLNIGWFSNGVPRREPSEWLSRGYDGVVFRGRGVDVTHMRDHSWGGSTVSIGRHNGIVRFENLTIHSGTDKGGVFGQQNIHKDNFPGFQVELVNVKGVVDPPFQYFLRNGMFRLRDGGSGYAVNQELTAVGGVFTSPAKFKVTAVDATGKVTGVSVLSRGVYTTNLPFGVGGTATTSNGPGAGAKLDLGQRPKWLWFGYNVDLFMQNVWSNAKQAVEHCSYMHGFAQHGATVLNSVFFACGAEGFKVRSDETETRWAGPNQMIYIADSLFRDWYQCWSWRGGGGVILQGSGAHVVMERNIFHGGPALNCGGNYPNVTSANRSMAIGISSEGGSYDQQTGSTTSGYGNGYVWLDKIAASGASLVDYRNNLIRIAKNGGVQKSSRGVLMDNMSLWGPKMFITIGDINPGTGLLRNSNTADLEEFAQDQGMDTSVEAVVPRYPFVPVSQGATW